MHFFPKRPFRFRRPRRPWQSRGLIGEAWHEVRFSKRQMYVRIYAPALAPDGVTWRCAFAIGFPVSVRGRGCGATSLQALVEAMRGVSRALYTSSAFRRRQIGGPNGGSMFFPATSDLHDVAPDRF